MTEYVTHVKNLYKRKKPGVAPFSVVVAVPLAKIIGTANEAMYVSKKETELSIGHASTVERYAASLLFKGKDGGPVYARALSHKVVPVNASEHNVEFTFEFNEEPAVEIKR